MKSFRPGDTVQHLYNRDLGPGQVVAVERRRLRVHFPRTDEELLFSTDDPPFVLLPVAPSSSPEDRWEESSDSPAERLARLESDPPSAWQNRWDGFILSNLRESGGLGSYLGGRIRLLPHQLYVAEAACAADPVRWLLADEVGLGKTVEACLILNHLLRTGRADRVLVVAPAALTVQWLGELYRKFHQTFALLDTTRRQDVRRDFGPAFNPFDAHPRSVVALEDLVAQPDLLRAAVAAPPDLLVVDEVHRLQRRPGHPGNAAYRTLAPLCRAGRHTLLLTATPLEADTHGFFRLLQLLRPDQFADWERFRAELDAGTPLFPCATSTRRADIGGLPPRLPCPVALPPWPELDQALEQALAAEATDPLQRQRRVAAVQRTLAQPRGHDDPRIGWLVQQTEHWRSTGDKGLVFVHERDALIALKRELEGALRQRVAAFHEDMSPAARDLEVARFAGDGGPTLMIATEAGGEGRNFEFCRAVVLFDLPWNPVLVEQRIGRLDRIGRQHPVEIHYFLPAGGFGAQVARLYETLGSFHKPLGGLDHALGHVAQHIAAALDNQPPTLDATAVAAETTALRQQVSQCLYRHLHCKRYRPETGEALLGRVPTDLDQLTARVVLAACRQYGFEVEAKSGHDTWYLEYGAGATVAHLPGVAEGSRWLGTFDREEAVAQESLDYFAAGHPLVEAVLLELADGRRGEVALLDVCGTGRHGYALLALIQPEGREESLTPLLIDLAGRPQPQWLQDILATAPRWEAADLDAWQPSTETRSQQAWYDTVRRRVEEVLANGGAVRAVAGLRLLP